MDWSKAKNILIISLIATNIFLLFTLFQKDVGPVSIENQSALLSVLESKKIFVNTELPSISDKVPVITLRYSKIDENRIKNTLQKKNYISKNPDSLEMADVAKSFLEDCRVSVNDLIYEDIFTDSEGKTTVRFRNSYKGITIGDSYVEVYFINDKVTGLGGEIVHASANGDVRLEVTSPEEALFMLMSQKTAQESIFVENIQLVYWANDSDFEEDFLISDTVFPAWKITYNGGHVKYFDAYRE